MRHLPEKGFTLIEIMVALTIGLFVVGAISTVYLGSKQTYRTDDNLARLQEGARFAMNQMAKDIRMTGFEGCNTGTYQAVNTLNVTSPYSDAFTTALQGYTATGGTWSPVLDPSVAGATPPPVAGSDVITIRFANPANTLGLQAAMPSTSADLKVATATGFQVGEIVMISNCNAAAIFQITNLSAGGGPSLVHNTGTGTPGNSTKNLGYAFSPSDGSEIMTISTVTYYLGAGSNGNTSLWRWDTTQPTSAPVELAQNVAAMRIVYGVDTDADQAPNYYVTADQVPVVNGAPPMSKVVAVRIGLILETPADNLTKTPMPSMTLPDGSVFTPTDHRLYRLFTETINLRNRTL